MAGCGTEITAAAGPAPPAEPLDSCLLLPRRRRASAQPDAARDPAELPGPMDDGPGPGAHPTDAAGPGRAGPGPARTSALGMTDRPSGRVPVKGRDIFPNYRVNLAEKNSYAYRQIVCPIPEKFSDDYLPSCRAYRHPVADRLRKGVGGVRNLCPGRFQQGLSAPFVTRATTLFWLIMLCHRTLDAVRSGPCGAAAAEPFTAEQGGRVLVEPGQRHQQIR